MADRDASPWGPGRLGEQGRARLLFGATYEDAAIEQEVLGDAERVLVIGAAGDTAIRCARPGRTVTAVDVNPAQVAYVRRRLLRGAPRQRGAADRLLRVARWLAPAAGWGPSRLEPFLRLADVGEQLRVFDEVLDTVRFRALMDAGFAPATLLRAYRPEFVGLLPPRFGRVLRARLRRGFALHPNATNPYVRLLLAGRPPVNGPPSGPVEVHHVEAAGFLDAQPTGSYDGFSLSNVFDGPGPSTVAALARAVARAGHPGAPVVVRTLREPTDRDAETWAARDRSMIWGGIIIAPASELPDAVRAWT